MEESLTAEEIAGHYSRALDSVNLVNTTAALETLTQDDIDTISRNVLHLQYMVEKPFWTTEDMTPLNDAITTGNAAIAE